MKQIIITLLSIFIITSCQNPKDNWRYEIKGQTHRSGKTYPAIWYTNTVEIGDNYLRYENRDGSEVVIPAPFILIDHKDDTIIKDYLPAFR